MHNADDLVMCLSDLIGHLGWYIGGLDGVHEGYHAGQMNLELVWESNYACQTDHLEERKRGRRHIEWEKMRQILPLCCPKNDTGGFYEM